MVLDTDGSNMNSIRTKMFSAFFGIILAVILVFVIFNAFLYKEYIIKKNELEFEKISKEISKIYASDPDYAKKYIRTVSINKGIQIDIVSTLTQDIVFSTRGAVRAFGKSVVFDINNATNFLVKEKVKQVDSEIGEIFIKSFKLSDEYAIIMYKPLVMIYDRVKSSTKFILLVSLFVILPGVIIVNYITKRHVKPIVYLQKQTSRIAALDFSDRFEAHNNDEIAILGQNINTISDKLSATINELENDIEKLSRADNMRKQFLASVSHEFKTPLSIISSYAESIKMGIVDGEEEEYLDTIIDETNRLNEMVKRLTNSLKMGFVSKDHLEVINVYHLINDVVERHNRKDNDLIVLGGNANCFSLIDRKSIIQVLDNFIVNAKKHMLSNTKISINVDKKDDQVIVKIFNKGKRIPEDKRNKIWNEFYKIDTSRVRGEEGSGLGLYINKSIIEWYGGNCGFINKKDGVEFYFTLPISTEA